MLPRTYLTSLCRPNLALSPSFRHGRSVGIVSRLFALTYPPLPNKRLFVKPSSIWRAVGIAGCTGAAAIALHTWSNPEIQCQDSPPSSSTPHQPAAAAVPPPPVSPKPIIDVYELSFGTVAGICAGVFVKKGLRTVAFFLGGFFVLVQAFNSLNIFHVNLGALSRPFEKIFYREDNVTGQRRAPTIATFWSWLVNFLTADFTPRASFLAGLVLGFRFG